MAPRWSLKRLNSCCMIFASTRTALIIITFYPANFAHFLGGGGCERDPVLADLLGFCWRHCENSGGLTTSVWKGEVLRICRESSAAETACSKMLISIFTISWFLGFTSLSFWRISGILIERSIPVIWIIIRWFSTACSFVFWGSHNSKSVIWMPTINISENLIILL